MVSPVQIARGILAAAIGFRDGVRRAFTEAEELRRQIEEPTFPDDSPTQDFEEYVTVNAELELVAECRVCGEDCPIMCEPDEFSIEWHYCGRSPRCCP